MHEVFNYSIVKIGFFSECIILIPNNLAKSIVKQAYYYVIVMLVIYIVNEGTLIASSAFCTM